MLRQSSRPGALAAVLFAVALFSACATQPSVQARQASDEQIERLLDVVGLEPLLELTRTHAVAQLVNPSMRMDEAARELARAVFRESFSLERVQPRVASSLRRSFDPAYAAASIRFLESSTSRSFVEASGFFRLPSRVSAGVFASASGAGFSELDERDAVIDQILALGRIREAGLDRSLAVTVAMWDGANDRLPRSKRLSRDYLWALLTAHRRQAEISLNMDVIPALRRLPMHQLEASASFLASDAGRWFVAAMDEALIEGLSAASREAGEQLVDGFEALDRS